MLGLHVLMTNTNGQVISDALSLIGVVSETEALTPEQGELCLRVLNNLLAEWANREINVGHWPQTDTTAEFPAGWELNFAVQNNLAVRLAPHFQRLIPPAVIADAVASFNRLLRDVIVAKMEPADMTHLPVGTLPNGAVSFDITNL